MSFTYAKELKQIFDIYGHFYNLTIGGQLFHCRNTLEIISNQLAFDQHSIPDTVVVMMNPGSSVPLDKSYLPTTYAIDDICQPGWRNTSIPTRPDNAQYQIMRLMLMNDWQHVKVLNLSDLRNGNSGDFSKEFKLAAQLDATNPHCITHASRRDELARLLRTKAHGVVLAAWGSVEVLRQSANTLLEIVPEVVGAKRDEAPWYRYASPYRKDQKLEWLQLANAAVQKQVASL